MKRSPAYSALWVLCFAMPLSLHVPPIYGDHKQSPSKYNRVSDYQEDELKSHVKEDFVDKGRHAPSPVRFKKRERLFHSIITKVAKRHQVDPALVKAIILAESEYNPNAVSRKGAKGLMQLMPHTAQSLGVEDIFDPEHNITGGVRHFKDLLNQFDGDIKLALAAYNAGSRKVREYKGIPPFKSTKRYIKRVFEYYEIYKRQM